MIMVRIPQHKVEALSANVEKMLKYGGMAMTCLTELMRENGIDERIGEYPQYREAQYREPMDPNYRYPQGASFREEEDWHDPEFRRGVKGTGRYSRF